MRQYKITWYDDGLKSKIIDIGSLGDLEEDLDSTGIIVYDILKIELLTQDGGMY